MRRRSRRRQHRDTFEDRYLDVLQNLEFAVVQVARENPDLVDSNVELAIDRLIRYYSAQAKGREPRSPHLAPLTEKVFESVKVMAELRIGNFEIVPEDEDAPPIEIPPITIDELIDCLRRIRKSVRFWHKQSGQRGYLNYIDNFLPK